MMGIVDVMLAFPSLILAIAIVTVLGPGLLNTLLTIAIVSIPIYARIMRSSVLSIKQNDYVLASRAIGSQTDRILTQSILPNALTPLVVQGTLGIAEAILDIAALSFLGLGRTAAHGRMGLHDRPGTQPGLYGTPTDHFPRYFPDSDCVGVQLAG